MKTTLLTLGILLITFSCAHQKSDTGSTSSRTPSEDQYWNDIASDSLKPHSSIFEALGETNPALLNQIITDSKDPILPLFWGKSLNFDSGAKKKIVEDKIIKDLQSSFNIKNDNQIVHAGVMHTYGYLFSTIDTPYGYKRKRWIAPTLNYAFGLNGNGLSPETIDGGLLSNVTYFSGMLAFTDKSKLALLKNVANEIFTFDYARLHVERVEEILKNFTLVTTLVKLPRKAEKEENDYLLIYSIDDKLLGKEVLITAFPVNNDSYRKIIASDTLGENQKITIRYNAYLDMGEKNLTGTRRLIKKVDMHK